MATFIGIGGSKHPDNALNEKTISTKLAQFGG
jgi:hypothetical protein